METREKQLLDLLFERSYEERDVILTSGKRSKYYIDGKQTTLHPKGATLVGELFYERIRASGVRVDAVGGPTLGADPIVTAITIASYLRRDPIPGFIIRKEPKKHGTMQWIEGVKSLFPGASVVLVEDVMTTGGSLLKAVRVVRELGYRVSLAGVLVDRLEGGREALEAESVPFFSLFTIEDLKNRGMDA
ncbi:MAG: orotate phosphoribosyltransferase [Deltaproteobacteria bacterium]|nr:MAG: orotate phosphoribosyltransferase [Deltaproteobacteria bacterium]